MPTRFFCPVLPLVIGTGPAIDKKATTVAYLRDEKGLHHLLYAYNTDRFATRDAYLEKYPGDEWADIAGFDIYQREGNTSFLNELKKTAKTDSLVS